MEVISVCPKCGYSMQAYRDDNGQLHFVCANCGIKIRDLKQKNRLKSLIYTLSNYEL